MTGSLIRHLQRQAEQRGRTISQKPLAAGANPPVGTAIGSAIREAAYFRAERRGLTPGQELEDQRAAERKVNQALMAANLTPQS